MGDVSSGPGGVLYNTPDGPSGLFLALDPAYQAKQQQVQQNQIALNQSQLFKGGLPTDDNGNTDWNAAYQKAMQAGAYDLAGNLVSTGIRMSSLNDRSTLDNPLGGGGQGGGRAGGQGGGFAPAAGGGMIATGAGGDNYGQTQASQAAPPTGASNSRGGDPTKGANPDVVNYIRSAFTARGINPNVALGVSASEGLRGFDPNGNSNPGDGNSSFGPFQLHMGGLASGGNSVAGLGDDFAKATGLDPRDPSTWKQQVNFVADHVAQNGWGAFHGAKAAGIGNWQGIGDQPAGQGQPQAPGQTPAPAGGQAQPISFGGPGASSPPSSAGTATLSTSGPAAAARARLAAQQNVDLDSLTPDQQAQREADVDTVQQASTTAGSGSVSDVQVMQARKAIQAMSGYAPESLAPGARQALAAAQDTVSTYLQQQNTPPGQAGSASAGTVAGAPTSSTSDAPKPGQHPYFPGGSGIKSAPTTAQPSAPAAGGMQPLSFGGPAAGGAPPSPPMSPGRQPPQGGGAPVMALGSQGGAVQPVSFGGGAPGVPQGGGAPMGGTAAPMSPALGAPPPEVGAALQRLQNRQGSAADGALWGAYMKGQNGGAPAGGQLGGPPAVGQSATSATSGPDIPNLPAGYQDPGGGTRYVNDVLAKASQFATAGDPRAKVWEARANQIQAQLTAAQGFKNNMALAQARADDRYAAANSPGAIAAAGAKAGAETTARNALSLVPSVQPDGSTIMIPQSDALASAQSGKPIVSAQPGYVTQGQGNLLAKLTEGSKSYQERQVASQRLDALSSLLETYQTGANSTAFNEAAANAKSLGISIPTSATINPGAMQEFAKDGYANVLSSMKEQGNKQYAAEVSAAVNSNPNPELQPEANAAMIAQMQGTKRWYDQNFRDYSQWYHGNKGAADDADFQTSWTDAHPLGAYVSAAAKDIAPVGIPQPAPGKLVDGQAYQTAGGKMRWSASSGRMVPFGAPTAPNLGGSGGGGAPPASSPSSPSAPPVSGARQARDGNWYVADPSRAGKFLQVSR